MIGLPSRYTLWSAPEKNWPRRLIGHSHGRDVYSPSLGFKPALPWSITWWDSMNLETNPGAKLRKLMFGTAEKKPRILQTQNAIVFETYVLKNDCLPRSIRRWGLVGSGCTLSPFARSPIWATVSRRKSKRTSWSNELTGSSMSPFEWCLQACLQWFQPSRRHWRLQFRSARVRNHF